MQDTEKVLAAIEAELAKQDAEWREAQEQILALGDVQLSLDPELLAELESVTQPTFIGSIPVGLTRM